MTSTAIADAATASTPTPLRLRLKWVIFFLLALWGILQLGPLIYMVITSLKTDRLILNAPFALPFPPEFQNYLVVLRGDRATVPFLTNLGNSIVVTAGALIILLFSASLGGYALARGSFPGSRQAQTILLLVLAIPVQVLLIPTFFLMDRLELRNTVYGLMLLYATFGLPSTTLLMRAHFLSFPRDLEEQALVDGCNRFSAFFRIVLPLSAGAIASMAIINITWIWGELMFATVLLQRKELQTLPVAVASYNPIPMTSDSVIGPQFAIITLAIVPLMLVYALFQKQIRKGLIAGALR